MGRESNLHDTPSVHVYLLSVLLISRSLTLYCYIYMSGFHIMNIYIYSVFRNYGKMSPPLACFYVMLAWTVNTQAKWNTWTPWSDFLVVHLLAKSSCLPHPFFVAQSPSVRFFKMFISRSSSFSQWLPSCLAYFTLLRFAQDIKFRVMYFLSRYCMSSNSFLYALK